MKIQLLSITLLMSSGAFAAQAPEKPAEKGIFASVLAQIKCGKKKEKPKQKVNKNSPFYVKTLDKNGNEIDDLDRQPAVSLGGPSGLGNHGNGWGIMDDHNTLRARDNIGNG